MQTPDDRCKCVLAHSEVIDSKENCLKYCKVVDDLCKARVRYVTQQFCWGPYVTIQGAADPELCFWNWFDLDTMRIASSVVAEVQVCRSFWRQNVVGRHATRTRYHVREFEALGGSSVAAAGPECATDIVIGQVRTADGTAIAVRLFCSASSTSEGSHE